MVSLVWSLVCLIGMATKEKRFVAYIRRLDVVNRGFSGYNTTQALKMLPRVVASPEEGRIRLMVCWHGSLIDRSFDSNLQTIFLGANDARLPNTPGFPQTVEIEHQPPFATSTQASADSVHTTSN
jgi:hypothetical protein